MLRTAPAAALLTLLAVAFAFVMVQSSSAGPTLTVTLDTDPATDGCATNGCSLREAVAQANGDGSTIEIPEDTHVVLTQGEITITGEFDIMGAGVNSSSVSANNNGRAFHVMPSGDVYIGNLTIKDGELADDCGAAIMNEGGMGLVSVSIVDNQSTGTGGGICNHGAMELQDVDVFKNTARGDPAGGGILNSGLMTITDSTVTSNTATGTNGGGDGAGIGNTETGDLTVMYTLIEQNTGTSAGCDDCSSGSGIDNDGIVLVEYSWISNNSGDAAAGLQNSGDATVRRSLFSGNDAGAILNSTSAEMLISNSTISGNFGRQTGQGAGGIQNFGNLSLLNATITNNTAFQFGVGGVRNGVTGAVDYKATIMSNNDENCDSPGVNNSNGYNVFDDDTCASVGTDQPNTDPLIGPLQDNGGPTWSHYLQDGSPAIDAGGPSCPTPDQLGANRVNGCDSGAVEKDGIIPTPEPTPSPTLTPDTYPQGDYTCDDDVDINDIPASLYIASGLAEPDYCGRAGGCVEVDTVCHPEWYDVNCDGAIDSSDVLWILLYEAGDSPIVPVDCLPIGTYAEPPN